MRFFLAVDKDGTLGPDKAPFAHHQVTFQMLEWDDTNLEKLLALAENIVKTGQAKAAYIMEVKPVYYHVAEATPIVEAKTEVVFEVKDRPSEVPDPSEWN